MKKERKILWQGKHPNPSDTDRLMFHSEYTKVRVVCIKEHVHEDEKGYALVMPQGFSEQRNEWVSNTGERQVIKQLLDENARLRKAFHYQKAESKLWECFKSKLHESMDLHKGTMQIETVHFDVLEKCTYCREKAQECYEGDKK
ncbi:MAG: hypothetical protein BA863_09205 [Desulfovibrio sp. S3730MH75]|nr:MAG: hypothetical protein BA863_09205 [Desulfovibrio sp. S3730MH75]